MSLRYRYPEQYFEIVRKLDETEPDRNEFINRFIAPIRQRLTESGIDFTIAGRVKSIFSIWSKMQRKGISFEDVYDLFAIRIVFKPTELIPENRSAGTSTPSSRTSTPRSRTASATG